jgi:murein DD-endopeptidase MepM/ murein hydrolase activator NlpD
LLTIPATDATEEELAKEYAQRQKKLAAIVATKSKTTSSKNQPSYSDGLLRPVNYGYISQHFSKRGHTGVDMVASVGTPVRAAQGGCVTSASYGWNGGYGTMIQISHGGGTSTLYGHLSDMADHIREGVCVDAGEVIGYVGSTGRSTGPHLHYEVRQNGVPQSPNY